MKLTPNLPKSLLNDIEKKNSFFCEDLDCENIRLIFKREVKVKFVPTDVDNSEVNNKKDPHCRELGVYFVPCISLLRFVQCDDIDKDEEFGLLLWLVTEKKFGFWDSSHMELFQIENTNWLKIRKNLCAYLQLVFGEKIKGVKANVLKAWSDHIYTHEQCSSPCNYKKIPKYDRRKVEPKHYFPKDLSVVHAYFGKLDCLLKETHIDGLQVYYYNGKKKTNLNRKLINISFKTSKKGPTDIHEGQFKLLISQIDPLIDKAESLVISSLESMLGENLKLLKSWEKNYLLRGVHFDFKDKPNKKWPYDFSIELELTRKSAKINKDDFDFYKIFYIHYKLGKPVKVNSSFHFKQA